MDPYEKKYKEALESLKGLLEGVSEGNYPITKDDIIEIFPELKERDDEKIRKELIGFLRNIPNSNYTCEEMALWLEEQGEQKPVDKVEPKFNVGDWIIDVQGVSANQIIGYEDDSYYIETSCSKFYLPMKLAEKNYRLWTIKDAKAGDVLYSPKGAGVEGIFLIKGWEQVECTGKTLCSSIGYRVEEDEIVVSEPGAIWWKGVVDPFYPATKEQRDLLFQKMKEEGYVWDSEKKQLRKNEEKVDNDDKVVIKKGEKPTAWSEEDEEILRTIISDGIRGAEFDMLQIDWLKSLKDRSIWKPSDEQMAVLNEVINYAANSELQHWSNFIYTLLKSLREQLKKLRGEKQ